MLHSVYYYSVISQCNVGKNCDALLQYIAVCVIFSLLLNRIYIPRSKYFTAGHGMALNISQHS